MRRRLGIVALSVALAVLPRVAAGDDPSSASSPSGSARPPHPPPKGMPNPFDPVSPAAKTPSWNMKTRPLGSPRPLPPGFVPPGASAPPAAPSSAPAPAPPPPAPVAATPAPAPAPTAVAAAPSPVHKRAHKRKPPPPPAVPSPNVRLHIDAPGPDAPWVVREENTSKVPLEVLADARLLVLDVTPPDAKEPLRCQLPHAMLPSDDDDRQLVIPPGRAYVETIDPRLFCFGAHDGKALVAGAKVVPSIPGRSGGPGAIEAIDGVEPRVPDERTLVGLESAIGDPEGSTSAPDASAPSRPLVLASAPFVSAAKGEDATIEITVTNEATVATRFLFRPTTLAFDVTGPSGVGVTDPSPTVHCQSHVTSFSPIPEVFTVLAPHERATLDVLLSAICPDKALDHEGLYVVHASLDTRRASGRAIGLRTFDGQVTAATTTRLRVEKARTDAPRGRPQLEPAPSP